MTPGADHPDLVGFGALNVDYIASASSMSARLAERVTESTARFEWNREGPVDEATIVRVIHQLGAASLGSSLGGSAWLTVFALAKMRLGLRLGYVGVVGRVEAPGLSFVGQMEELGIDQHLVSRRPDLPCGICLSYIDDTDRVMLTYPGANSEVAGHIKENFEPIATYLASARYVHVTSFLDNRSPGELLKILRKAKSLNPRLQLSFDPGFDWAERPTAAIEGILALTNLLFVNYREFKALGRYIPGDSDDLIARAALARCATGCTVFVTKRYDYAVMFRATTERLLTHRFQLPRPVPEMDLEDATGAGDVFAAGVLASLMSHRLQVELGAYVGLSLARHRMRQQSPNSRHMLPDLSVGFLQTDETGSAPQKQPAGVFLVHDNSSYGPAVRQFVQKNCGLPVYEATVPEAGDPDFAAAMGKRLASCSLAICLLSARDTMSDGSRRVAQNIVHQAGIFQGRYGFGRVAILVEEDCDTFSNIAGLIRIDFSAGRVEGTFPELERMLRREGLLK